MSEEVLLTRTAQHVLSLTLNRPEKRNALNSQLVADLRRHLAGATVDETVRVVTIAGAGPDFCAGADLSELLVSADAGHAAGLANAEQLAGLFLDIRALDVPVVALVTGRALGGGCGLASACDLVLAEASARFGYPEVRIGFAPAIVMAILRRNVTEKRAFEMIATGDMFAAREMAAFGLINRVYPDERFAELAGHFVTALADRSADGIRMSKQLLYRQDSLSMEAALHTGAIMNVLARNSDDARAGFASFAERAKGKPSEDPA